MENKNGKRILGNSRGIVAIETALSVFFIFSILTLFLQSVKQIEGKKIKMLNGFKKNWTELDKKHAD